MDNKVNKPGVHLTQLPESIKRYFASRRSVRAFASDPVAPSLLNEILELAAKAPTCGNMQLYSVIVTSNEPYRDKLNALHFNQPATKAPVLLTVCADFSRFTKWCRYNDADAAYGNFLSFTSAYTDASLYAQQVVTIAEMAGLGTCYLGTVLYNAPEIGELLGLPELTLPVACIALGWPAGRGAETERLPRRAYVHEGKYRGDSETDILEFFKVKEEFEPNKGFAAENGKANLAQVFAEVRYPRTLNVPFSAKLLEELKRKGWM